jgi:ParB/RepB/Spo0J family partition protein
VTPKPVRLTVDITDLVIVNDIRDDQSIDAEFLASIKAFGVLQPPIVSRYREGRYLVEAGRRRVRHALEAGITSLDVIVVSDDALGRFLVQVEENLHRKDWSPLERAKILQEFIGRYGWTQQDASDYMAPRFRLSRVQIAQHLALLRMTPDAQALLSDGSIEFSAARELCTLNDQPDLQRSAVVEIRRTLGELDGDHITRRQVAAIVTRVQRPLDEIQAERDQRAARLAQHSDPEPRSETPRPATVTDPQTDQLDAILDDGGDVIAGAYLQQLINALTYLTGFQPSGETLESLWAEARERAAAWISQ